MKHFIIIAVSLLVFANIQAQNKMKVWLNDNTSQTFDMNNVSRVTFEYSDVSQKGFIDNGDGTGYMDGYEWVDLGDGVKWATCNVGALSPSESGKYFAWGEVTEKEEYTQSNYKIYSRNVLDSNGRLFPEYDAATVNMSEGWRMPTSGEFKQLIEKYTWLYFTLNGIAGYKVVGKNGNYIFLSCAGGKDEDGLSSYGVEGRYRTCTSGSNLIFNLTCYQFSSSWDYRGLSVRGVVKESQF